MELIEEVQGRVVVVTARGRLDGSTSQAFATRLETLTARPEPRLVVDFSGIDFVSSAGLRVVLSVLKRVKAAHGMFALCAVQQPIRQVLDITGFPGVLLPPPGRAGGGAAWACLSLRRAGGQPPPGPPRGTARQRDPAATPSAISRRSWPKPRRCAAATSLPALGRRAARSASPLNTRSPTCRSRPSCKSTSFPTRPTR